MRTTTLLWVPKGFRSSHSLSDGSMTETCELLRVNYPIKPDSMLQSSITGSARCTTLLPTVFTNCCWCGDQLWSWDESDLQNDSDLSAGMAGRHVGHVSRAWIMHACTELSGACVLFMGPRLDYNLTRKKFTKINVQTSPTAFWHAWFLRWRNIIYKYQF